MELRSWADAREGHGLEAFQSRVGNKRTEPRVTNHSHSMSCVREDDRSNKRTGEVSWRGEAITQSGRNQGGVQDLRGGDGGNGKDTEEGQAAFRGRLDLERKKKGVWLPGSTVTRPHSEPGLLVLLAWGVPVTLPLTYAASRSRRQW